MRSNMATGIGLLVGAGLGIAATILVLRGTERQYGPDPAEGIVDEAAAAAVEPDPANAVESGSPAPGPVAAPESTQSVEAAPPPPQADRTHGQRVAQAQLKVLADMVYRPLYEELALDPSTRAQVGELITESFAGQQRVQQEAMRAGDRIASDVRAELEAERAALTERLAGILDDRQMAAWNEYDAFRDQVLYEAVLDGQLRMLAPGLDVDSHERVLTVFAEELLEGLDAFNASQETYNLDHFNEAQLAALQGGLQRLRFELPATQFEEADEFVNQVKTVFDAMKRNPPPAE